jgi:phosphatidylserine/phosphatidylglycerophosphate/cardiolipin synthase-like enzyme
MARAAPAAVLDDPAAFWRRAPATRAAPLIDGAAYFRALAGALREARRSVLVLGWDIHANLALEPDRDGPPLARFVDQLAARRSPELEVRLLISDWILPYSLDRQLLPRWRFGQGDGAGRVRLELDDRHPPGACHHEKLVVIDGRLAFVGGIDLTNGRWDLPAHRPREPRRSVGGDDDRRPPFHDLMLMLEGPVAAELEALARERWQVATGELVPPAGPVDGCPSPWPAAVAPWFRDVEVAIARTRPDLRP